MFLGPAFLGDGLFTQPQCSMKAGYSHGHRADTQATDLTRVSHFHVCVPVCDSLVLTTTLSLSQVADEETEAHREQSDLHKEG